MGQKQKIIVILTILICSLFLSLPLLRSGLSYSYGIGFWGPTGHDLIWHLNLINHIGNFITIPLASFSGVHLQNYHPFYDILIALIHQITAIPINYLVFQIYPLVTSLIFLWLSFRLGHLVTKKYLGGIILVLLNTFMSSLGWVYTLFTQGRFGGESLFWSMQSASIQINPPLILSYLFILSLLVLIIEKRRTWISIILLSLLPITKAYGGVAGYFIWGFYSLTEIKNKNYRPLFFLLVSLVPAFLLFRIYNSMSTSLFVFSPFWFISSLFSSTDKFYIPKIASAMFNYQLSHSWKLIPLYLGGLGIFLVGNFSFRLIGIYQAFKKINSFKIILLFSISLLTVLPLLFVQSGTAWNTIQFLYYALLFSNILLADALLKVAHQKYFALLLITIFASSLLTNLDTYQGYLGKIPPAALPNDELPGLNFLNSQKPGNVLTYPFDAYLKNGMSTPIPLYAYETNAYVSAYTKQNTYLADEMNLNNSGYDWSTRRVQSDQFFLQKNQFQDRGFLVNNQIDYVYLTGKQIQKVKLDVQNMYLTQIYNDGTTLIYRVNR